VPVRYVGGALFLLVGTILALGAWGIVWSRPSMVGRSNVSRRSIDIV